jgi:hypothetical protein
MIVTRGNIGNMGSMIEIEIVMSTEIVIVTMETGIAETMSVATEKDSIKSDTTT